MSTVINIIVVRYIVLLSNYDAPVVPQVLKYIYIFDTINMKYLII